MSASAAMSTARSRLIPMRPRDPREPGRTASTLELFFDLVFVVAVSIAAVQLHHALTEPRRGRRDHLRHGVLRHLVGLDELHLVRHSFATDDWLYRVLTIVQMAGVLVLAAGSARVHRPRLHAADPGLRRDARRDGRPVAARITPSRAQPPRPRSMRSVSRCSRSLALPAGAARVPARVPLPHRRGARDPRRLRTGGTTPWHPHHITERYGLFTLILLGESLLASANAVIEARPDARPSPPCSRSRCWRS